MFRDGAPLVFGEALEGWRGDDAGFRLYTIELLRAAPFKCFRFETPPVTIHSNEQPFEFALVDSPEIDLAPDPGDFMEHFERRSGDVLAFSNLGGDAVMVVPRPPQGAAGYAHLAGFLRYAPLSQQEQLWQTVAATMLEMLGRPPLWLNTAGGGVPWLHVRIDSRPKYYVFDDYRGAPGS